MSFISAFEVIGPNMIGPSSSHTAGAAAIANLASRMIAPPITEVSFTLYGSFADTYHGHGTDRALLGGVMGFQPDDERIRESFEIAEQRGIKFDFIENHKVKEVFPNTADIHMKNANGDELSVRGESIGGGKIRITGINGIEVYFTGEYTTIIVMQQDLPGVVAHLTKVLADMNVNVAFMRLFREAKGSRAYTIIEADENIPESVRELLLDHQNIHQVMLIARG